MDGQRGVGLWTFDGSATGLGMADFLTGRLTRLEHARPGVLDLTQKYLGVYVQDTWRIASRVTLNGGVRWEPFFGQHIQNKAISNFNIDNFRSGTTSTVYRNAPPGFLYPGDPGFPAGKSGLNNKWMNFAPRIGAAWDVTGDGRMAVRSSYSLGYDFQGASYLFISATAPPYAGRLRVTQLPGGFDDPYLGFPGGPPHPVPEDSRSRHGVPVVRRPGLGRSEQQLGARPVVERHRRAPDRNGLAGIRQLSRQLHRSALGPGAGESRRLSRTWSLHAPGVVYPTCTTTANLNQRRELSLENPVASRLIGSIERHEAVGTQNYHALQLSTQRRAASGVGLSANYTRSYCVGNDPQTTFFTGGQSFQDPDNPDWDRGNCTYARRHNASVSAVSRRRNLRNRALRVRGLQLECGGHLQCALGRLAHRDDGSAT